MITRRQFLYLAGAITGVTAVHLLPLVRLQAKTPPPAARKLGGGLPVPFTIPVPIGRDVPHTVYMPMVKEGGDDGRR